MVIRNNAKKNTRIAENENLRINYKNEGLTIIATDSSKKKKTVIATECW